MIKTRLLLIALLFFLVAAADPKYDSWYREIDKIGNCPQIGEEVFSPQDLKPSSGFDNLSILYLEDKEEDGIFLIIAEDIFPSGKILALNFDSKGYIVDCKKFPAIPVDKVDPTEDDNLRFISAIPVADDVTGVKTLMATFFVLTREGKVIDKNSYDFKIDAKVKDISVWKNSVLFTLLSKESDQLQHLHWALFSMDREAVEVERNFFQGKQLSVAVATYYDGFGIAFSDYYQDGGNFLRLEPEEGKSAWSGLEVRQGETITGLVRQDYGFYLTTWGSEGTIQEIDRYGYTRAKASMGPIQILKLSPAADNSILVHGIINDTIVIARYSEDLKQQFIREVVKGGGEVKSDPCVNTSGGGSLSAISVTQDKDKLLLLKMDPNGNVSDRLFIGDKQKAYALKAGKAFFRVFIEYPAYAIIWILTGGDPMP